MAERFKFYCPTEIYKGKIDEKTGEEEMLLGGIASTADKDADDEYLDPKGFDLGPFMKTGLVNWHHQAKTSPETIVGEPTKAEIRKDGLYIETKLYPSSPVARNIYQLAQTLEKDSKTRHLGYSIEGRVLSRKSNNPADPDYNKIDKAVITGVAITYMPKNPKTFANIIKGEFDELNDEEDEEQEDKKEEKDLNTEDAAALKREHVDSKLKNLEFGKAEVFDFIFRTNPNIEIEKAKQIFSLIQNVATMKKNSTVITEDDIIKAYDALGLDSSQLDITKGDDTDEEETAPEDDEEYDEDDDDKGSKVKKGSDPDEDDDEETEDEDTDEDEDDDEDEDTEKKGGCVKKGGIFDHFNAIEKAITTSHVQQSQFIKACGVLIKANSDNLQKAIDALELANDQISEQKSLIKAQDENIAALQAQLDEFGSAPAAPRAVRHAAARPVERTFGKGGEDELNPEAPSDGLTHISIMNKAAVDEVLDAATFHNGGYDEMFSKACTAYEATKQVAPEVRERLKQKFGVVIEDK